MDDNTRLVDLLAFLVGLGIGFLLHCLHAGLWPILGAPIGVGLLWLARWLIPSAHDEHDGYVPLDDHDYADQAVAIQALDDRPDIAPIKAPQIRPEPPTRAPGFRPRKSK